MLSLFSPFAIAAEAFSFLRHFRRFAFLRRHFLLPLFDISFVEFFLIFMLII